jgi:hypothetical protein
MNAYDNASLIMYPSGYKASKIYSLKPTDGSGDLTFTRASSATRVNESGLVESVATNIPRIDYTGGGCGKLLLEPQRTNLITYSEDFSDASWTKIRLSVSAAAAISPDGTTNASKLIEGSSNQSRRIYLSNYLSIVNTNYYTYSIFLKKGERDSCKLAFDLTGFATASCFFDLTNGVYTIGTMDSVEMVDYGDGWYKCSVTKVSDQTIGTSKGVSLYMTETYQGLNAYKGDGVSGLYVWGGDFQEGSYPTSYIPTAGTTVTRVQDESITLGITSLIGQTEGTFHVKFTKDNIDTYRIMTLWGGGSSNRLLIYTQSNALRVACISGGVNQFEPTLLSAIGNGTFNVAFAYKDNDFEVYVNGVSVYTNTSASVPIALNDLLFGQTNGGGLEFNYEVDAVTLFKTRLTGTQLAELTTI